MSNDLKRYAFDATRGEMFEIAHGAYVKHDDHLTALTAAVQAEREAIKEMIVRQHKVNVPDEQFRSGVHFACENLHAMIRSRGPAPAVDARGIVREYVEAHAGLDNEFEIRSEESIAAETRFESAYNALCALATPTRKEND